MKHRRPRKTDERVRARAKAAPSGPQFHAPGSRNPHKQAGGTGRRTTRQVQSDSRQAKGLR